MPRILSNQKISTMVTVSMSMEDHFKLTVVIHLPKSIIEINLIEISQSKLKKF